MRDFSEVVGIIVIAIIGILALTAVFVWPTMIMFGVVHSYWAWLPAFGFWQTLGVLVLAKLLTGSVNIKE